MPHQIEPHLPALTRYAKALCKGRPWLDHRDLVNEAVVAVLRANPNALNSGYVLGACNSRFKNIIGSTILHHSLDDDYHYSYIEPYDTEEMYEKELLLSWAEYVLAQRCPRGQNTPERDKERRKQYLKEYRKRKKHEKEQVAA